MSENPSSFTIPEGVDVNSRGEEGLTPLFVATYAENEQAVKALLANGAGVNTTTVEGWTPLMAACLKGNVSLINILLQAPGVDLSLRNDDEGMTAFMFAAQVGCLEAAELLYRHDPVGCSVNAQSKAGWTALMLASQNGYSSVAGYLLDTCEANANLHDGRGFTALHFASQEQNVDIVRMLLRHHASARHADSNGVTPLHLAALAGHMEICEALVTAGARVDAANVVGCTPLKIAELAQHAAMQEYFEAELKKH